MELIIGLLGLAVYFLPTILAYKDDRKNKDWVCLVNLFLGWTVIGWFIAFVMQSSAKE